MNSVTAVSTNLRYAFFFSYCLLLFSIYGQPVLAQVEKDSIDITAPGLVVDSDIHSESSELEQELLRADRDEKIRIRVVRTGIVSGGVLSFLLVLFGYLRLNHATRGYYSRRLLLGAASAMILIAVACYFLIAAFI